MPIRSVLPINLLLAGLFLLALGIEARALTVEERYLGKTVHQALTSRLPMVQLRQELHRVLSWAHVSAEGKFDTFRRNCALAEEKQPCFQHTSVSYTRARRLIYGSMFLESKGSVYSVTCAYCEQTYMDGDLYGRIRLGPDLTPNHYYLNVEHTWPQSQFSQRHARHVQKADLHALFPVGARINTQRGNLPFGEVLSLATETCPSSKRGFDRHQMLVFEPPHDHKGNVARALFYFAIRYEVPLPDAYEELLRRWHHLDPVDEGELSRNDEIFMAQKNRNPFVDHPDLVDLVLDF